MANDDVMALIRRWNGEPAPRGPWVNSKPVVPPYLEPVYNRVLAARKLRDHLPQNQLASAALLRAAFSDEEEDVRKTAILVLVDAHASVAEAALCAAAFDKHEGIRGLSLEGLHYLRSPSAEVVASMLVNDSDPEVAALAANILNGRPVRYYNLEAISG